MVNYLKLGIASALAISLFLSKRTHDEAALLSDWSAPPPWPIFIALNVLAGVFRSAADALTPPPIKILDFSMAYHQTILVHVAQKFKIPDLISQAKGGMTGAEIAEAIGSDGHLIERVMFACAAHGVFQLGQPTREGTPRFVNTALSAVLREDHPNSMRAMVGHNVEDVFETWWKLPEFLKNTNGPIAWDIANPEFPFKAGGIWKKFEAQPENEAQFGKAMTSLDSLGANAMVADGPFSKFSRIIDVGGGKGHFLHRILEAHPALSGVVLDRKNVIELAKTAWASSGPFSSAASRAQLVSGSFFDLKTIPKAKDGDAFLMRYVLHDWPDDDVKKILKNVRAAIGNSKASLVIGECALPDHSKVGVPPVMYNIDVQMMVAFGGSAQERTPTQWKKVLGETGFELVALHPTRSLLHWVEAKPV